MNLDIEDYLRQDRQWFREQRIAHARYRLLNSTDDNEKGFWLNVIKANALPGEHRRLNLPR